MSSLLRMRVRLAPGVARPSGRSSCILLLAAEKGRNNTVSQRQQQTTSGRKTTSTRTRGRGTEEVDKRQTLSGKRTGKGRTEEVSYVKPRTMSSRPAKAVQEEEETEPKPDRTAALVADVKAKVEYVASRPQLLTYAGAAAGGLLVTSILISAVNDVPLLPKVLELAGLVYIASFIYNYLLSQTGRQKLAKNLLEIKDKVTEVAGGKTDS